MVRGFSIGWLAIALVVVPPPAWAVPPSAKPAQVLTLIPQSVSKSGNVYAYVLGSGDTYRWDASTKTQQSIYQFPETVYPSWYGYIGSLEPKSRVTAEESVSISRPVAIINSKYRFRLTDHASKPATTHTIEETRYLTGAPVPSPNGESYAFAGTLETSYYYYVGHSVWILNLSEFLWDLSLGLVQPTGFYLTKIFQGKPSVYDPTRYYSPDQVSALSWSTDSQKLAFGLTSYDPRGYQKASIQIYDKSAGILEEAFSNILPQEIFWGPADTLFATTAVANAMLLNRIDLKNKTSDRPLPEGVEPFTISIASDASFVAYNPAPVADPVTGIQTRAAPVLYDLKNKQKYSVENAALIRLSLDGKHVAISRDKNDANKPEAPLVVAPVKDVVGCAKEGRVSEKELAKVATPAGTPVLAYHPPTDNKEFWGVFETQKPTVTINGNYVYGAFQLKNKSNDYYAFSHKEQPAVFCELYDEAGALISKASPYPIPEQYRSPVVLNPGGSVTHYCNSQLTASVNYGTKGKLVLYLSNYETASRIEYDYFF